MVGFTGAEKNENTSQKKAGVGRLFSGPFKISKLRIPWATHFLLRLCGGASSARSGGRGVELVPNVWKLGI